VRPVRIGRTSVIAGVMVLLAGAIGAAVSSSSPVGAFLTVLLVGAGIAVVLVGINELVRRAARGPASGRPQ